MVPNRLLSAKVNPGWPQSCIKPYHQIRWTTSTPLCHGWAYQRRVSPRQGNKAPKV